MLALPAVEDFRQRFLPWLAAAARGEEGPATTQVEPAALNGCPPTDEHEPTSRAEWMNAAHLSRWGAFMVPKNHLAGTPTSQRLLRNNR